MAITVTLKGTQQVDLSFSNRVSISVISALSSGSSTLQVNPPQGLSLSGPTNAS
jgi:hypothetical protein